MNKNFTFHDDGSHFQLKAWTTDIDKPSKNTIAITVFDAVQFPPPLSSPPVSLAKSWSLIISLKKKFILKILELELLQKRFS